VFDRSDLRLTNASATRTGSGTSYRAVLTPASSGKIKLSVAAARFTDAAGNDNKASNEVSSTVDITAPTISIADLTGAANGDQTAVITLSEASTNFVLADLSLTNASATLAGSGSSYTAVLTPAASGKVKLSVSAARFTDAAGNDNTASNEVSSTVDITAPTVALSTTATSVFLGASFEVGITFSEPVTGLLAAEITVGNGTVTALTGSGADYIVTTTASGSGEVAVLVLAGVAQDAAGNDNRISNRVRVEDKTVEETQKLIANFMQSRANQLLSNQPRLTEFLSGSGAGHFSANVTRGRGVFNFANDPTRPMWMRLSGSMSKESGRDTRYVFGALGSHAEVTPNLLVGAMLQFDHVDQSDGLARIQGTGWLAGPYVVARNPNHPLFFEGRFLYGQTNNRITPFGTYTDSFKTDRWLAQVRLTGEFQQGTTTLMPSIDLSYTQDAQRSYLDSLGNAIPKQSLKLGQIAVGLDFIHPVEIRSGALELTGGIFGIWSHTSGTGTAATVIPAYEGGRARTKLGLHYTSPGGGRFNVDVTYDGIGAKNFESYGMELGYALDF
jgi:hypothetical protein